MRHTTAQKKKTSGRAAQSESRAGREGDCGCDCDCGRGGCCCGCSCCCGDCPCCAEPRFHRRFRTRAEQIAELEAYADELKNELTAVKEKLADLRR